MKTQILIVGTSVVFLTVRSAHAQDTFQNLDFEQANPVIVAGSPYYPYAVTTASALPFWTVTVGGVQQTQITENDPSTGAPWVMLMGPGYDYGLTPIDGNYGVLLQGNSTADLPSISQTGLVPAGTQSLLFEAKGLQNFHGGAMELQVGSQIVPFTAVGTGPNYTLYGADISEWAGQTTQLTFSALENPAQNNWELDDISFSPNAVPEPCIGALTAIGGLLFGARKWFARRS